MPLPTGLGDSEPLNPTARFDPVHVCCNWFLELSWSGELSRTWARNSILSFSMFSSTELFRLPIGSSIVILDADREL